VPRFRISELAQSDLENITRYTRDQWGRDQRDRYMLAMETQFEVLAQNPRLAAERVDYDPPVRIYKYEKHLIVYAINDGGILIIRVLHQSMDVAAHLSH